MKNFKKFSFLMLAIALSVVSVLAYEYNVTVPVKGKTEASEQLQKDSMFTIYSFAVRTASPDCQNFSIVDTRVEKAKQDGAWEEIWTVNACDKNVNIPVKFTEKGTYTVNPMGVKYTEILAK